MTARVFLKLPSLKKGGDDELLSDLIPANVQVYAISLGGEAVRAYVEADILPPDGYLLHATNSNEFAAAVRNTLNLVSSGMCSIM